MEAVIIGMLFTLILGSFSYTWASNRGLWSAIKELRDNDLKHLEDRVTKLEQK